MYFERRKRVGNSYCGLIVYIHETFFSKEIVIENANEIRQFTNISSEYTHARNVLTVIKRVERSRSIVIIKHKYMLMCNHKIRINLKRCLRNSTARREISQLYRLNKLLKCITKCRFRPNYTKVKLVRHRIVTYSLVKIY